MPSVVVTNEATTTTPTVCRALVTRRQQIDGEPITPSRENARPPGQPAREQIVVVISSPSEHVSGNRLIRTSQPAIAYSDSHKHSTATRAGMKPWQRFCYSPAHRPKSTRRSRDPVVTG